VAPRARSGHEPVGVGIVYPQPVWHTLAMILPSQLPTALAVAVVVAVAATSAGAEEMLLQSKTVTAVGLVDIAGGRVAAAREAAIKQAIRNAIEEVLGFMVESTFTAEQKEVVKDGKSQFSSTVEDRILTKSSGFVESHQVILAKRKGKTFRAVVEVVVRARSLQAELAQVEKILAAAGYPKIILLIAESYTDRAGHKQWIEKTSAGAILEGALLARNIELLAKERGEALRRDAGAFALLVANDAKVAALAAELGADVAVVGVSDTRFSGHNEMGANMYFLSARVSLRAVRGSSGKILASFEVEGKGVGVNETQARQGAVKKAAPKAADQLLTSLIRAWRAELERGNRFVLVFDRVKNYRRVARPLLMALEGLPGVDGVAEVGYEKKRLEVELRFAGSSKQLLNLLFDQVASKKPFENLDKTAERGERIELTF